MTSHDDKRDGACAHDWSRPKGFSTKKCSKCGVIEPADPQFGDHDEPSSKDALWNLVRLAAEGSDWKRDNETLQEWAFRKLRRVQSATSASGDGDGKTPRADDLRKRLKQPGGVHPYFMVELIAELERELANERLRVQSAIDHRDTLIDQLTALRSATSASGDQHEASLLADEIESVGKGLAIDGKSIEGGRELTPEEDALIVAALRAYAPSSTRHIELADPGRIKTWFYSKPRKPAELAFTAGPERQIAYMMEEAALSPQRRDIQEKP